MISNEASKYIYELLFNDSAVNELVGNKIYPIVAENGVDKCPFISFKRQGTQPLYTKDGLCREEFTLEIVCIDIEYDRANLLAIKVRKLLDNHSTNKISFRLQTNGEEWIEEERHVQSLVYNVTVYV